ncbi:MULTISPECIES: sigma 54-interacting transcriptional regulator [Cupriavidus]
MTANIGFIVPNDAMHEVAKDALAAHRDIRIRVGLMTEAGPIANDLIEEGAEIIIARAETARTLKDSRIAAPIVDVPITISDLIRAVESMKPHGTKIGVVCFASMIYDLDWLGQLLGVELRKYLITHSDEAANAVRAARDDGNDGIIGGGVSVKRALEANIAASLIPMGREAILLAAQQARQIQSAMVQVRERNILINTIFDNAYEGIVTTDAEGNITSFNLAAEKLTGIRRASAIGAKIDQVWPALQLDASIRIDQREADQIIDMNGTRLVCGKAPIVFDDRPIGAIATFQETARIEKMEVAIRKKTYAQGHVAHFTFDQIIGASEAITDAIEVAKDYAKSPFSVLILGETGTGKEAFAQSIHNASRHADGPFVAINCAALPAQILESELFGYVGGAFTGASREGKPGLFEVAHNGTVFLDEIGEMDYANQGRLLRFLQEKTIRRLGSERNIPVNVRIVAATNQNLDELVAQKTFREDLFYRLNVLSLTLPPLRERRGDVARFVDVFLERYAKEQQRQLSIEAAAIRSLEAFAWPGNVRQLQNVIARLVITAKQQRIGRAAIESMMKAGRRNPDESRKVRRIKDALERSGGKYADAAALLGVDRSTLWRWLKNYRIEEK